MTDSWRTSVAAASTTAVAAGAATGTLTHTLDMAASGMSLAVGVITAAAVAAASLAVYALRSRGSASVDRNIRKFLDDDWPEIRWADMPPELTGSERNTPGSYLGACVYSRWCETSDSLKSANQLLEDLPFRGMGHFFGWAALDQQGRVKSQGVVHSVSELVDRTPDELRWLGLRGSTTGRQPSSHGAWSRVLTVDPDSSGQSVELRFELVVIALPNDRDRSFVGVVSPLSSLTEVLFGLVRERFEAEPATPRFQVQDLIGPGVRIRSARFAAPGVELIERYAEPGGFFENANRLNERKMQGITVGMADITVNIFSDGQVYIHNADPADIPFTMSAIAQMIWPHSRRGVS